MNRDALKQCAWDNAPKINGENPNQIRMCKYCNNQMNHGTYCQTHEGEQHNCWDIDHITPRSKGGTDTCNNVIAVHGKCNSARGNQ